MRPSSEKPAPPNLIQQFRAKTTRQKIHPREKALLAIVSAMLIFQPWAFGSMRLPAQAIGLGLGVLALLVALLPRDYAEAEPGQAPFRLFTWPKLLRFPIFWLGLVLFGIIVIQALNPAWNYTLEGRSWWMTPIPHVKWLPTGVRVPFEIGGPWRMLINYAATWLCVCAVWCGFTRRRTFQAFFAILAGNAFLLAGLGVAERALGAQKIFWFWTPPASYFVSSFTYKNHAGAYFDLMLALCAGLSFWYYDRSQRRLDKSGPAGVFAFFATAVAMIVIFSYSRTATILMFGFLLVTFGIFVWRMFIRARPDERRPLMLGIVVVAFAAFIWIGMTSLKTSLFVQNMGRVPAEIATLDGRTGASSATWEMAADRLGAGWGSGSFRFIFPVYQQRHPAIFTDHGVRMYWEHTHNDYAELFAEFGCLGALLALLALGYAGVRLLQLHAWTNPLALFLCLGSAVTLVHCYIDFNFFNPAILTVWAVLLFGTIRWIELEEMATGV